MSKDLLAIAGVTLGLAKVISGRDRSPGPFPDHLPDDTLVNVHGFSIRLGDLRRVVGSAGFAAKMEELRRNAGDPEYIAKLKRDLGIDEDDESFGAQPVEQWYHSPSRLTWADIIDSTSRAKVLHPTSLLVNRPRWTRHSPLAQQLLGPPSGFSLQAQQQAMSSVESQLSAITAPAGQALTRKSVSVPMARSIYGLSALMLEIYGAPLFEALGMGGLQLGTLTDETIDEIGADLPGMENDDEGGRIGVTGAYSTATGEMLLADSPFGAITYLHEIWHKIDHHIGQRMIWQVMPEIRRSAPPEAILDMISSSMIPATSFGIISELLSGFWVHYLKKAFILAFIEGQIGKAAMIDQASEYLSSREEAIARVGQQMTLVYAKRAKLPFYTVTSPDFLPRSQIRESEPVFLAGILLSAFGHGEHDFRPSAEAMALREAVEAMHPSIRRIGRKVLPLLRSSYGQMPSDRIEHLIHAIQSGDFG
jgi:hypothetical protein